MVKFQREDIHILARHTTLNKEEVKGLLKLNVYNDKPAWQQFLSYLFLSLGVGFVAAGIVFFFAYNWADLHKFMKIGLIEVLIITTTCLVLMPMIGRILRNVILTGTSVLVGVLFAVFGQIYQTGANAYDLFFAWTLCITLWAVVAHFAPLWLLFLVLINTTLVLYSQQVVRSWSAVYLLTLLFSVNIGLLLCFLLIGNIRAASKMPSWFIKTLALASAILATLGITIGIFEEQGPAFLVLLLMTIAAFVMGAWHGFRIKSAFYPGLIVLCVVVIIAAFLLNLSDGAAMFLLVGLFIVSSVTLSIRKLIDMQKEWADAN